MIKLFHNYFGTKPVVYRSIQNALVALVVFVFAGIFCSSTAFASNAKNNNGVPVATQQCGAVPTDCSDIELCHRATFGGKEWRDAPVFKKFIKEAKSRNLECEKIFSYDLMSSIDKNGLSFGAFPPQPKLKTSEAGSDIQNQKLKLDSVLGQMIRGEIGSNKYSFATFTPEETQEFLNFTAELVMDKPFLAKARGTVCDFLVSMKLDANKVVTLSVKFDGPGDAGKPDETISGKLYVSCPELKELPPWIYYLSSKNA